MRGAPISLTSGSASGRMVSFMAFWLETSSMNGKEAATSDCDMWQQVLRGVRRSGSLTSTEWLFAGRCRTCYNQSPPAGAARTIRSKDNMTKDYPLANHDAHARSVAANAYWQQVRR